MIHEYRQPLILVVFLVLIISNIRIRLTYNGPIVLNETANELTIQ